MNTELTNSINATSEEAQYDASAKRLLSQKNILAHILINTVDEFKGMNYKDVVPLIEGTPYVSTVPIEPGLTNTKVENDGQRITGFNSEDKELNEGLVWFDIVFYVRMKDGLSEELPEHNKNYELHRLLGTLLSNELTATEKLNIIGNEYDIPIEEKFREEVDIMCNLSQGVKEKGIAIGEERGIAIGEERGIAIGEERGIAIGEERGIAIGEERGIAIGEERGKTIGESSLIRTMYNNGLTPEQISKMTSKSIDDINAILAVEVI